jgi:hypothetical protein
MMYAPAPIDVTEPNEETAWAILSSKSLSFTPAADLEQTNSQTSSIQPSSVLNLIRTLGRLLDDLERTRIMQTNRIGALEREHGEALPHLHGILEPIRRAEHLAELELVRAWRKYDHPAVAWSKQQRGVGEKTIARLIAEIGDPAERPNVAKLWAYCGLGDPARKRRKGMTQAEAFALGNPAAKKCCWNLGESFVKVRGGPYRTVYDQARLRYSDRVHAEVCVRCGPAGKPAAPGSPWSLKHQHEAAKRYAEKAFLRDLWIVSRPSRAEAQSRPAGDQSLRVSQSSPVSRHGGSDSQVAYAGDKS